MIEEFGLVAILLAGGILATVRFLTVRGTVSRRTALAADILQHGTVPSALADAAWTGSDYRGLDDQLDSWNVQIRALAHSHDASPFLHDFPGDLPVALAVLDDALSILLRCVPSKERPDGTRLRRLRGAINEMLKSLKKVGLSATKEVPARPIFPDRIKEYVNRVGFESEGEFMIRRSLLLAWVRYDGQSWYDDQPTFWIGKPESGTSRPATS